MAQILNRARQFFGELLAARRFLPWLIVVAVAARLAVAALLPVPITSDAQWYAMRAYELIHAGTYSENGVLTAFWPVGYPALLSAVMRVIANPYWSGAAINIAATIAALLMIPRITLQFTDDVPTGNFAAALLALYPAHVFYAGQLMTEPVYIAVLLAAFWLLVALRSSWPGVLAAGILFGLGTYLKAQTYLYPVGLIIALWMVYRHYRWQRAVVTLVGVYVGLFATVLPWSVRNYHALGSFVLLSTNGGATLYDGNNPLATGGYSGFPLGPRYKALLPTLEIPPRDYVRRQVAWDALTRRMAVDWIKQNPAAFVKAMPRKIFLLWGLNTDAFYIYDRAYAHHARAVMAAKIISLIYYLGVMALALWAAIVALRGLWTRNAQTAPLALLYTFPVFTTLIAIVFSGQSRFNLPCMPFLMIAVALVAWRQSAVAR